MSKVLESLVRKDKRFADLTVEPENYPAKYWLYLADGFVHGEVHCINGPTVKEVLEQVKEISTCTCSDCIQGIDLSFVTERSKKGILR